MPYVFAHHFSGSGTAEALELYRSSFRPSPELAEPRTFLTVNAVVAETAEEAERRALPNLLMMVALRTGAPLAPQLLVEEAEKVEAARRAPPAGRGDALALGGRRPGRRRAPSSPSSPRRTAWTRSWSTRWRPPTWAPTPARSPAREETLRLLAGVTRIRLGIRRPPH